MNCGLRRGVNGLRKAASEVAGQRRSATEAADAPLRFSFRQSVESFATAARSVRTVERSSTVLALECSRGSKSDDPPLAIAADCDEAIEASDTTRRGSLTPVSDPAGPHSRTSTSERTRAAMKRSPT